MTQWPPTCPQCGAPLGNGVCPRCRYSKPAPGKTVFTGIQEYPRPPRITLLTTGTAAAPDLVVPDVTVQSGSMLYVAVGQLATLLVTNSVCSLDWNGHTLTQRSLVNAGNDSYLSTFSYVATATETGELTILNGDPAMIRTTSQVFQVSNINTTSPFDLPITEAVNLFPSSVAQNTTQLTTQDLELIVANLLVAEASSPDGTWESPIIAGPITNGTGLSDGGTNGFRMHEGHREVNSKANYTMRKTFPSNINWGLVIAKIKAP